MEFNVCTCALFVGTPVPVGISPSNCVITKIKMDKDRKSLLDRKDRSKVAA
jgi:large subunit ribosomal protein L26e